MTPDLDDRRTLVRELLSYYDVKAGIKTGESLLPKLSKVE